MYKQVIVLRKDLKWKKGKMIAHAIHASIGSLKNSNKKIVRLWEKEGAKKVILKIENLRKLKRIYNKVKKEKIPCFLVKDAGLTQLKKGTITALGIGPDKEEKIDKITRKLKLL
jgi:PTH2 family peptidyl-tRNA hydrolase